MYFAHALYADPCTRRIDTHILPAHEIQLQDDWDDYKYKYRVLGFALLFLSSIVRDLFCPSISPHIAILLAGCAMRAPVANAPAFLGMAFIACFAFQRGCSK